MRPPAWTDVPAWVADWVRDVTSLGASVHDGTVAPGNLPEELARLHGAFERLHPFLDGNGRAGRLVLNLMLVRLGYPPAIIFKRQRDRYLDALARADRGDPGPLRRSSSPGPWSTTSTVSWCPTSPARPAWSRWRRWSPKTSPTTALRQAARRGRLEAELGSDGIWRSTRRSVAAYRKSRYRRDGG